MCGDDRPGPEQVDGGRPARVRQRGQHGRNVVRPADEPRRTGPDQVVTRVTGTDTRDAPVRGRERLRLQSCAVRRHHRHEVGRDLPLGRDRTGVDPAELGERAGIVAQRLRDQTARELGRPARDLVAGGFEREGAFDHWPDPVELAPRATRTRTRSSSRSRPRHRRAPGSRAAPGRGGRARPHRTGRAPVPRSRRAGGPRARLGARRAAAPANRRARRVVPPRSPGCTTLESPRGRRRGHRPRPTGRTRARCRLPRGSTPRRVR